MRDWNSPEELQRDLIILLKAINVWTGVYFWEVLTSMSFEMDFIKKRRVFQWQMLPYFISRYFQAVGLLCLVITMQSRKPEYCYMVQILTFFIEMSVVFAGINFALRTMAIWTNKLVTRGISILVIGHAGLVVYNTVEFRGHWSAEGACLAADPAGAYGSTLIIRAYAMVFDAVLLILSVYKLVLEYKRVGRGSLVRCLLAQGMIYFLVAFVCNAFTTAFLIWQPNLELGIIGVAPAAVFTVIASCRCVRHLSKIIARRSHQFQSPTLTTVATGPLDFLDTGIRQDTRDMFRSTFAI